MDARWVKTFLPIRKRRTAGRKGSIVISSAYTDSAVISEERRRKALSSIAEAQASARDETTDEGEA